MPLRAFRIIRIFRAFKLVRYNKALNRFAVAAKLVKEEAVLFLIVTAIFLYIASAGIFYFENAAQPELFSSIFTFFILMIGVGIMTIPAGLVASALTKAREMEDEEKAISQKAEAEDE